MNPFEIANSATFVAMVVGLTTLAFKYNYIFRRIATPFIYLILAAIFLFLVYMFGALHGYWILMPFVESAKFEEASKAFYASLPRIWTFPVFGVLLIGYTILLDFLTRIPKDEPENAEQNLPKEKQIKKLNPARKSVNNVKDIKDRKKTKSETKPKKDGENSS